jgi:Domain of unknown function (DUF4129)
VLAVLLAVAAVGSRALLGGAGAVPATAPPVRVPVEAVAVPLVVAVLAGLGLLAVGLRPARRRRDPEQPDWVYEPPPVPWQEKALVLLSVALLVGVVLGTVWLLAPGGLPRPAEPPASAPGTTPPVTVPTPGTPPQAPWLWPAAGVVVLAGGAGLLAARTVGRRRHREAAAATGRAVDRVDGVLADSAEDLRAEPDPRRAVLAAYARMEGALAPRGAGRLRHETALEYLERLLARRNLEQEPLRRLTGLFQLARFSDHQITQAMRADAVGALEAITASLRSPT